MPKTKEEKKKILENLSENIKSSEMIFWAKIKGLEVNQQNKLRSLLKENNASLKVTKKTLINLAFKREGFEPLNLDNIFETLVFGFAFEKDFIPALKVVYEFSKENEEAIEILGGFDKKKVYSAEEIKALAQLPSKDILLSNLLGSLNAPIYNFVFVLKNNLSKLIWALNAIKETKSS